MLSKATAQLVEEVYGHFRREDRQKAKEDPEACLMALLTVIKEELPLVYATLGMTIEKAPSYLKEARRKLRQTS